MTMLNIEDSLVLIIDVQEKLLNAVFNKLTLEKKAAAAASAAKIHNILKKPLFLLWKIRILKRRLQVITKNKL